MNGASEELEFLAALCRPLDPPMAFVWVVPGAQYRVMTKSGHIATISAAGRARLEAAELIAVGHAGGCAITLRGRASLR
ncbi:MAG: hypothetical protein HXX10_07455 [Rhodoplanes sp.]|uniref:hypothetical protein n=1 Tax=Rhodoplanes sp. TaxID=1968906 RepID=UPI00184D4EFD|nr:hypothetical protein [Rhodoplanes sp.]NVO13856.1 hypothetical protein [Rhodoplanes sp.]